MTALETIRDGVAYPTTVTKAGKIVAFTVGLSRLDKSLTTATTDIHFLDSTLRRHRPGRDHGAEAGGQEEVPPLDRRGPEPDLSLQPYLGQVVQFPLDTSIPVTAGRGHRADRTDLGAGAVVQPAHDEVRLPAEPHQELHPPGS